MKGMIWSLYDTFYGDRDRLRAIKQAEYEERQRLRGVKQAEYEERQRLRGAKQAEYEERQRLRGVKQAEYEERQRLRAVKQAEYEESKSMKKNIVPVSVIQKEQLSPKVGSMSQNKLSGQGSRQKRNSETTPAFRKGDRDDIKTTIILSAPGQCEEVANRPAAGQTGKTLQTAINILHEKCPSKFPTNRLDDYAILNAVEDVHYRSKTGRTEGTKNEVCDLKNLERINEVLNDSEIVVALGEMAQLAVDSSSFSGEILKGSHPSKQALNKTYDSHKDNPSDRNRDRIDRWTMDMLARKNDRKK